MHQDSQTQLTDAIAKFQRQTQDHERKLQEQERQFQQLQRLAGEMELKLKKQAKDMETVFYQRCDQAMEVAIQEIHDCVDDATDKFNAHIAATMELSQPT